MTPSRYWYTTSSETFTKDGAIVTEKKWASIDTTEDFGDPKRIALIQERADKRAQQDIDVKMREQIKRDIAKIQAGKV